MTRRAAKRWWIYVVRCCDGALYTGIAIDVGRRLEQHRAGAGAKALRGRGPLQLVVCRVVGDRAAAQRVEARLKRLRKVDKESLVASPRRRLSQFVAAAVSGARRQPSPSARS